MPDPKPREVSVKYDHSEDALKSLQELTGSNNEANPWLGVCASVALLKGKCEDLSTQLAEAEAETARLDKGETQAIEQRDALENKLDDFVDLAGGVDECGEHSNINDPYDNALSRLGMSKQVEDETTALAATLGWDGDTESVGVAEFMVRKWNDAQRQLREARGALVQARGALTLDHMVQENGEPYGTTVVALEAIDAALTPTPEPTRCEGSRESGAGALDTEKAPSTCATAGPTAPAPAADAASEPDRWEVVRTQNGAVWASFVSRIDADEYRRFRDKPENFTIRPVPAPPPITPKILKGEEALQALAQASDKIADALNAGLAAGTREAEENERPAPRPIGRCPGCGTPIYSKEGFCGVCEPHKL